MLEAAARRLRAKWCWFAVVLSMLSLAAACCGAAEGLRTARLAGFVRPGSVSFPPDNPFSPDKAELGRQLFFDSRLSVSFRKR
jgi:cytochrome c peroxidase